MKLLFWEFKATKRTRAPSPEIVNLKSSVEDLTNQLRILEAVVDEVRRDGMATRRKVYREAEVIEPDQVAQMPVQQPQLSFLTGQPYIE